MGRGKFSSCQNSLNWFDFYSFSFRLLPSLAFPCWVGLVFCSSQALHKQPFVLLRSTAQGGVELRNEGKARLTVCLKIRAAELPLLVASPGLLSCSKCT